jgi:hypothetical protein
VEEFFTQNVSEMNENSFSAKQAKKQPPNSTAIGTKRLGIFVLIF